MNISFSSKVHKAAYKGHLEMTRILLDVNNINVNLQDNNGNYLFHISNQFMNISLLIKYGKLKIWQCSDYFII